MIRKAAPAVAALTLVVGLGAAAAATGSTPKKGSSGTHVGDSRRRERAVSRQADRYPAADELDHGEQ